MCVAAGAGGTGWSQESHQRTLGNKWVTVFTLINSSWLGPGVADTPESGTPRCPGGQVAQRGGVCLGHRATGQAGAHVSHINQVGM